MIRKTINTVNTVTKLVTKPIVAIAMVRFILATYATITILSC